jgi:hypothetical protein
MSDNSQAQELAKQMVIRCPKGYWIVEDHYSNTVYYKNQTPPHDTIPTEYAINHVLIAHQDFRPECLTYHIAFDKHDPANKDGKRRHYSPVG